MSEASKAKEKAHEKEEKAHDREEKRAELHAAKESHFAKQDADSSEKDKLIREAIELIAHIQHHNDFTRGWLERAHKALGE
jgi:hypothetical protein